MANEHLSVYKWEGALTNNWDNDIQEDESGNIINVRQLTKLRGGQIQRQYVSEAVRRGLIRYLVLAIDCSASASEKDFRPNRIMATKAACERFILQYFDQNPISQLCLAQLQDSVARKLTDMSGSPKVHIDRLRKVRITKGLASLQNTMKLAILSLRHVPNYGHRELLIVFSSLSTTDPGNIDATIAEAVEQKIRISIVCLTAEIYVCKRIALATGGSFHVAVDNRHLVTIMRELTTPSPQLAQDRSMQADFVYMGFPRRVVEPHASYVFDGKSTRLSCTAYVCPRCFSKTSEIPTQCNSCTLQLNSSSHIARSFHHICPVPMFEELDAAAAMSAAGGASTSMTVDLSTGAADDRGALSLPPRTPTLVCSGCSGTIYSDDSVFKCPRCAGGFCYDCDQFIHEGLHNCPGCA
jgi:transcription initiation factor TFIIH subunit 2